MEISAAGLDLLKRLEGCRLEAYPDPGSGAEPWTIGYGHTGAEVRPGLVISQEQAERWLLDDLQDRGRALRSTGPRAGPEDTAGGRAPEPGAI